MTATTAGLLLAWIAIIFLTVTVAGLVRQVAILRAAPTLAGSSGTRRQPTAIVPTFEGIDFGASTSTLLLFVDGNCPACRERIRDLEEFPHLPEVVLVSRAETGLGYESETYRTLEANSSEFASAGAFVTPYAMHVDQDGSLLAARSVGSKSHIEDVLSATPVLKGLQP